MTRLKPAIHSLVVGCTLLITGCGSGSESSSVIADTREINSATNPSETTTGTDKVEATDTNPPSAPQPLVDGPSGITDLILITGQSNALGAETTFDPELDGPSDRFYAYTDAGWQRASLKQVWDLGWHPRTSPDTDPHNNFGMHFGKSISSRASNRVVGIVLVTAPGEGISHWDYNGYFYTKMRNKAVAALNELPHKSSYDGILWHQGETDWSSDGSNDTDLSGENIANDYYSNKLWTLITNLRSESWFDYSRPFICGETAQSPINSRLMALNRDNDYWTACVAGSGLPTYDDVAVHFNAEGLRELGENYARMYLELRGLAN